MTIAELVRRPRLIQELQAEMFGDSTFQQMVMKGYVIRYAIEWDWENGLPDSMAKIYHSFNDATTELIGMLARGEIKLALHLEASFWEESGDDTISDEHKESRKKTHFTTSPN